MAMMAGGPAAEETKGSRTCACRVVSRKTQSLPRSPQQQRSKYKAAWLEAMKIELHGHKTTGSYEPATPPRGRKPVGAKWVFFYKTDKDGR